MVDNLIDIIDKPHMGPREITDETKQVTYGRFFTDEEYETRRNKILSTPLPGY